MPMLDEPRVAPSAGTTLTVAVAASAVVELYWATAAMPASSPAGSVTEAWRPDLLRLVGDFWGVGSDDDPAAHALPEVLVLADRAGALTVTDLDALVEAVVDRSAESRGRPALRSEAPADRAVIWQRLAALARSRRRREAWGDLLRVAAGTIAGQWTGAGLGVARRAARARSSQLPWSDPAASIVGWAGRDYAGSLPALLEEAAVAGRPVLVTPAYWSGRGMLFDLEAHLLVGIPARPGTTDSRARVEQWIPGLRAMADPTRLALLDHLAIAPRTVTELAADFGLAQPTVSRHVRLLRDAGLLTDAGDRRVGLDPTAVGRLLGGVGAALVDRDED